MQGWTMFLFARPHYSKINYCRMQWDNFISVNFSDMLAFWLRRKFQLARWLEATYQVHFYSLANP